MNTPSYDKVDEYRTLDHTKKSYGKEEFQEKLNSCYKI